MKIHAYDGTGVALPLGDFRGAFPKYLTVYRNKLYFQCVFDVLELGAEPWYFDGTTKNFFADIYSGKNTSSYPAQFKVYNDSLYFSATDSADNYEMYYHNYDTESQTNHHYKVEINPYGSSNPAYFTEIGYKLFFQANGGINGKELWIYDAYYGDPAEIDLYQGSSSSDPDNLVIFAGKLYFAANNGDGSGRELYRAYYNEL